MWAADESNPQVLETLIEQGAEVNLASRKGTTAAIFAVWSRDAHSLQLLAEAGADLTVRCVFL